MVAEKDSRFAFLETEALETAKKAVIDKEVVVKERDAALEDLKTQVGVVEKVNSSSFSLSLRSYSFFSLIGFRFG